MLLYSDLLVSPVQEVNQLLSTCPSLLTSHPPLHHLRHESDTTEAA